jgi:hypothetical protein
MAKGKMIRKFLVSLMAIFTLLTVMTFATAYGDLEVSVDKVEVNGLNVETNQVAGEAGEVVPVEIYFEAGEDATDVEISTLIQGERSHGTEEDFRDLVEGSEYHARLSLKLPEDLDEIDEDLDLYVRIETDEGNWEESWILQMQREPYNAELLFIETESQAKAGSAIPVDVVVKNLGRHELEDLRVAVSIPELGVSKRAYFGDLEPTDDFCDIDWEDADDEDLWEELACNDDDDDDDARERRIYLTVPENTPAGSYELVVETYNEDSSDVAKGEILVTGNERASRVVVPVSGKSLGAGETVTYDLVIVNSGSNIGVYEVIPQSVEGVLVSVDNPVVTVQAGSSRTVPVQVKAGDRQGTYTFSVDINSDGQLVETVGLTANIDERVLEGNVAILTVVLAIIFVVLLIVLIVLLTRKPSSEELEESYY